MGKPSALASSNQCLPFHPYSLGDTEQHRSPSGHHLYWQWQHFTAVLVSELHELIHEENLENYLVHSLCSVSMLGSSQVAAVVKNPPANAETPETHVWSRSGRSPGVGTGNPQPYPWKIPWTGKPHRLQSIWLQRVRHNWVTKQQQQQESSNTRIKIVPALIFKTY